MSNLQLLDLNAGNFSVQLLDDQIDVARQRRLPLDRKISPVFQSLSLPVLRSLLLRVGRYPCPSPPPAPPTSPPTPPSSSLPARASSNSPAQPQACSCAPPNPVPASPAPAQWRSPPRCPAPRASMATRDAHSPAPPALPRPY